MEGEIEYEEAINALIPKAEKLANRDVPKANYSEAKQGLNYKKIWGDTWNRSFFAHMDLAAAIEGLRFTQKTKQFRQV